MRRIQRATHERENIDTAEGAMKDGQMISIPWVSKDALDGMLVLDPMEELAYRRILDLIYVTEDNLPDDDKKLAWMTKTGRQWKRIKASLIAIGKITVSDHKICNTKCTDTIQKTRKRIEQRKNAGKVSAERRKILEYKETNSTSVDPPLQREDSEPVNETANAPPTSHKPLAISQKEERILDSAAPEESAPPDPCVLVIRVFDDARAEVFGKEDRRPFPTGDDKVFAERFLTAGATVEWLQTLFLERMAKRKKSGESAPDGLKYFAKAVPEALQ